MNEQSVCGFRQAVNALGPAARFLFDSVGEQDMALTGEIRLRAGAPVSVSLPAGPKIIGTSLLTVQMLEEMVLSLCGHSVYSHQEEMASGFISVPGGHRAGICGTAVIKDGRVTAVRDVQSICLRIARRCSGCSRELARMLLDGGLCSAVIAGAPGSGKTTLLRDLAAGLSDGRYGRRYNIAVVDERGEFSSDGHALKHCDVLRGYPKAVGIVQAVRSLSPDAVICDEIGTAEDIAAVRSGVNAGVRLLCSVHAGSPEELVRRPQTAALLSAGDFDKFVLLAGRHAPGTVGTILNREEAYEISGGGFCGNMRAAGGLFPQGETAAKGGFY